MKLDDSRIWYGVLFAVFILFRLFVANESYFVGGDEAKYLKAAMTFPAHETWNNQLELYNQPFVPYLFAIGNLFSQFKWAQIVILGFSILFFIYCIKFFKALGKSDEWIFVAMTFIALAHEIIMMSYRIYKEPIYLALFVMMLYYFLRALRGENKHYWTTALLGIISAYTTDHILLFIPLLLLMIFVFNTKNTSIIRAFACIAIISIAMVSWFGVRAIIYSNNEWYPAGVDGTPEYVKDFGLREILSPSGFSNTALMIGNQVAFRPAHWAAYIAYMFNMEPALITPDITYETANQLVTLKQILFMFFVYIPLIFVIAFGIWLARPFLFTKPSIKGLLDNEDLFFAIMYIILNIFIVYKGFSNRYSLGAIIPLAFFFAQGVEGIVDIFEIKMVTISRIVLATVFIMLVPLHIVGNQNFLLTLPYEVDAQKTSEFLAKLPGDGIMSQAGYTPEIAWLTHPKRVLSLPRTPEHFEELLEKYRIAYVVYGERYWAEPVHENKELVWDYETIEYVRNHPEKFVLLKTITEEYKEIPADELRVYRVV